MDKYLQQDASYERLLKEYTKYNGIIVCVDFDDTLYDFHGAGNSYELVSQLIRDLHKANCYIIVWTGNQDVEFVKDYMFYNRIPFHTINEESPISKRILKKTPRKVYANVYLDDRAGLSQTYNELKRLLDETK